LRHGVEEKKTFKLAFDILGSIWGVIPP